MYAFILAMTSETEPLLSKVTVDKKRSFGFAKYYECHLLDKSFIVVQTGIGKAFASAALASLVVAYPHVDKVVNVGVSGSLDPIKAPILTPVIATSFVEHDLDTSAIGDPVGLVSGINVVRFDSDPIITKSLQNAVESISSVPVFGPVSSGDTFFSSDEPRERVVKLFGSIALDMESAPLAQIAYVNSLPYGALRVISDADSPKDEYPVNAKKAAELASCIVVALINGGK